MNCDTSQWNYHGPKHEGHKRCMRERRRIDAQIRSEEKLSPADVAKAQAKRSGQGVDSSDSAGQGGRGMVSEVSHPPSIQRERRNKAGSKVRESGQELSPALAMSEKFRRGR
jgi:hypothetical protein